MPTDTSEKGLESLIVADLTGLPPEQTTDPDALREAPAAYGGVGYILGNDGDYDREYCVDLTQLRLLLEATQPEIAKALDLARPSPARRQFLARMQGEISKRGVVDVREVARRLENGAQEPHSMEMAA